MKPHTMSLTSSVFVLALLSAGLAGTAVSSPLRPTRLQPAAGVADRRTEGAGDSLAEPVRLPADWRQLQPFASRFPYSTPFAKANAVDAGAHVIDLEAVYFGTDELVTIDAGGRVFHDPDLSSFPASLVRTPFRSRERDLFIVQANSPADQTVLLDWLLLARVPILGYMPNLAYLVRMTESEYAGAAKLPEVNWIGLYQPAYRIHPAVEFAAETDPERQLQLTVLVDRGLEPSLDTALSRIRSAGHSVVTAAPGTGLWVVRTLGPAGKARLVQGLDACTWVEQYVPERLHNDVARTSQSVVTGRGASSGPIMDVEDVWARGIRGEGQIAAAADTGLDTGDITTVNSMHWDFGQVGSATNPMRIIKGYALGRPPSDWSDPNPNGGHGTHTSGSIVANGIRSGATPSTNTFPTTCHAGTAPKAQFVFQSIQDSGGGLGGIPADLNTLFAAPYADGARVHSNSWGSDVNGQYTTRSSQLDQFAWNNKLMVITFSAGNSGNDGSSGGAGCPAPQPRDGVVDADSMGAPATAKNCITVGASEDYRPGFVYEYPAGDCTPGVTAQVTWGWFNSCFFGLAPLAADRFADNANGMAAFSSRGPTDDGRFKPDVVAPGVAIMSTRTSVNQQYEQWGICGVPEPTYYLNQGGTSMANPLTAGAAVLVRQYYVDGWHPNGSRVTNGTPVPADGFQPSSALVKATLINGAWDMAPGQYGTGATQEIPPAWDTGSTLPNNVEGYGRVDLEHSLFPGSGYGDDAARVLEVHDVTAGLTTGGSTVYTIPVGGNGDPLIITLVWTDPWAAGGSGTKLINNLDLVVTDPSSNSYYPNGVDKTTGSADNLNNVEQVKVTNPASGNWTVTVQATNVPGNGSPGTTVQPYALVISGILCSGPAAPGGVSAVSAGNNAIGVTWTTNGATSYKVYRSLASGGPYTLLGSTAAPPYIDTTVSAGITYYYVVRGVNSCADGAQSAEASAVATGSCDLPPAFGGVTSVTSSPSTPCALALSWSAASAWCGGTITYSVYRSTTSGFTPGPTNRIATGVSGTSYTDQGALATGTTYYYVVRAAANGIEDANTTEASGSPVSPTTTAFSDDMESATPSNYWIESTTAGTEQLARSTCRSVSGTRSYKFGNTSCLSDYAGNQNNQLTLGGNGSGGPNGFYIPAAATTIRLRFQQTYEFETTDDWAQLQYSTTSATGPFSAIPDAASPGVPYITAGTYDNAADHWTGTIVPFFEAVTVNCDALAGQTVWFRWQFVTDGNQHREGYYLDDVILDYVVPCTSAPNKVTYLTVTSTNTQNKIEWQNPSAGYGSTRICVRTDTFPSGPSDGFLVDQTGTAGAHDSFTHTSLTNGTTYYYAAFVNNGAGTYSNGRTCKGRPQDTVAGPVKWVYTTGAATLTRPGVWPAASGGAAYVVSNDRVLHSTKSAASGGDWPATWTPMTMNAPSQARPTVIPYAGMRVAVVGSQDGHVYAVNAQTGAPIWTSPKLGTQVQAAPSVMLTAFGGVADLVLVGSRTPTGASKFFALNLADGTIAWTFDNGGGANAMGIINGQATLVYVSASEGRVFFASRSRGGGSPDTVWGLSFNASTATKLWSRAIGDVDGSPALASGRLYVGTNTSHVHALDPADGTDLWSGAGYYDRGDGAVKVVVFPAGGRLYFSTTTKVTALTDGGSSPSVAWERGTISNPSVPLPSGGYVWVGSSDGKLYQLDSSTGNPVGTAVLLGAGAAVVGGPTADVVNNMVYAGTDEGTVYGVSVPLP